MADELKNIMQELLTELNIIKYVFVVAPDMSKGNNFMGEINRVDVRGEDENGQNKKLNLIVKIAPNTDISRSIMSVKLFYEREIYVYEKVFPAFVQLQNDEFIADRFERYPTFFKSSNKNFKELLIMENMKELGFQMNDRQLPFNYHQTLLVIKELGKLHALSFILREKNHELFDEISSNTRDIEYHAEVSNILKRFLGMSYTVVLNSLDSNNEKVAYQKLAAFQAKVFDVVKNAVTPEPAKQFAVLGHCDCWSANILFKYENNESSDTPTRVCLLDWQYARICSPALDISQLMFNCCDKQLRALHYTDLIDEYYKTLSSFTRQFGCDPKKLFPFTVLQEHLKRFSVYGLLSAIKTIHILSINSGDVPELHSSLQDNEDIINMYETAKRDKKVYSRIIDVVMDYIEYGYNL